MRRQQRAKAKPGGLHPGSALKHDTGHAHQCGNLAHVRHTTQCSRTLVSLNALNALGACKHTHTHTNNKRLQRSDTPSRCCSPPPQTSLPTQGASPCIMHCDSVRLRMVCVSSAGQGAATNSLQATTSTDAPQPGAHLGSPGHPWRLPHQPPACVTRGTATETDRATEASMRRGLTSQLAWCAAATKAGSSTVLCAHPKQAATDARASLRFVPHMLMCRKGAPPASGCKLSQLMLSNLLFTLGALEALVTLGACRTGRA